jgi:outer membrane protein
MKCIIYILALFIPLVINSQEVLDDYVRYGLDNNLALKQKQADYRNSIEVLREARGLFYPSVSINARYTVSEGGRVIDFPVGDLLNPVYSTLNTLTASNLFPQIENQQVRFLRPAEHETKIRIAQPLFNPDIYFNSKVRKEMTLIEEMDVNQYRRELIAEIKKAYYNASMTKGILSMLTSTRDLLTENVRVNRRLIENDKITPDVLYRSEAELNKFDQGLQIARKNYRVANAYFNFLLNRPLSDSVMISDPVDFPGLSQLTSGYPESAVNGREELKKLENYKSIAELKLKMDQAGKLPDLFVVADYGFQGEKYRFNNDHDYIQASAVLTWTLFEGFRNRARISQSLIQKEMADNQLEEAKKQIELQVTKALEELSASEKGITAAEGRLRNARESYRIVERKYGEGQANLIEYMDARSALTQAEESLIISRFNYLSAFADFESVAAINNID